MLSIRTKINDNWLTLKGRYALYCRKMRLRSPQQKFEWRQTNTVSGKNVVTLVLSYTVSEILQVFVLTTPPLFYPIFGVFPLDQIAHVGVSPGRGLELFGREIIFEVFKPMW